MEAYKLATVEDFLDASTGQERIELVNGEIIKRPMTRFSHALAQSGLSDEISPFKRRKSYRP